MNRILFNVERTRMNAESVIYVYLQHRKVTSVTYEQYVKAVEKLYKCLRIENRRKKKK